MNKRESGLRGKAALLAQRNLAELSSTALHQRVKSALMDDPVAMERYKEYLREYPSVKSTYGSDYRGV
jgi:hypothetical protein